MNNKISTVLKWKIIILPHFRFESEGNSNQIIISIQISINKIDEICQSGNKNDNKTQRKIKPLTNAKKKTREKKMKMNTEKSPKSYKR